jgi:hypothetical protein
MNFHAGFFNSWGLSGFASASGEGASALALLSPVSDISSTPVSRCGGYSTRHSENSKRKQGQRRRIVAEDEPWGELGCQLCQGTADLIPGQGEVEPDDV